MPQRKPYTPAEIAWAERKFASDKAAGTLKASPGLIAVGFSDGTVRSRSSEVTYRDYLRDARRAISVRPKPRRPRPE